MGITLDENTVDLLGDRLYVEDRGLAVTGVSWGPRIGISAGVERLWRAFVPNHPAVSAPRVLPGVHGGRRRNT
jgi:DNA-3-methyladenine glycosylase